MWFAPEQSHTRPRSIRTSDEGFCYDEQNRLTWAATSGTPPCNAAITSGTLSGGTYSNTYAYDALNRLLSVSGTTAQTLSYGPGMQAWPSPAPLHGVVSASSTSYAYDAAGDRTNAGSATNLLWDAERRLVGWTSGSGATTATAAYDGDGGV